MCTQLVQLAFFLTTTVQAEPQLLGARNLHLSIALDTYKFNFVLMVVCLDVNLRI